MWSMCDVSMAPVDVAYVPQASIRKHRSSVKKSMKNMMVERSVQRRRMVVKMNQPVRKKASADCAMAGSSYGPPLPMMFQLGVRRMP